MPIGSPFSCPALGSCHLGPVFCLMTAWNFEGIPVQWGWVGYGALDLRHGRIGTSAAEPPADNSSLVTAAQTLLRLC